jgi:hypothetical protein
MSGVVSTCYHPFRRQQSLNEIWIIIQKQPSSLATTEIRIAIEILQFS